MRRTEPIPVPAPSFLSRSLADIVRVARAVIALALVVALIIIARHAGRTVSDLRLDTDVLQDIQTYVEAIFQTALAIGIAGAAYLVTKAIEP